MTRYVIGPDIAVRLAAEDAVIRGEHQVLASALLRSQVLALLYLEQAAAGGHGGRARARRCQRGLFVPDGSQAAPRRMHRWL
jgi:hypothetical protein